jgi:hypothetical protein
LKLGVDVAVEVEVGVVERDCYGGEGAKRLDV